MLRQLSSEWIKLRSTKGVWLTSVLTIVFAVALAALMAFSSSLMLRDPSAAAGDAASPMQGMAILELLSPQVALAGMSSLGLMVITIQAVLNVTSEYSHNTIRTSVLTNPRRWQVPLAKALVYAAVAAVVTFVASAASLQVFSMVFASMNDNEGLVAITGFNAAYAWSFIGRLVVVAAVTVFLATGVAFVIRATALSIGVLLLWQLVLEPLVMGIPKVSEWLHGWLPFVNAKAWASRKPDIETQLYEWFGVSGDAFYFVCVSALLFVAGTAIFMKRDA